MEKYQEIVDSLRDYGEIRASKEMGNRSASQQGDRPFLYEGKWVFPLSESEELVVDPRNLPDVVEKLINWIFTEDADVSKGIPHHTISAWLRGQADDQALQRLIDKGDWEPKFPMAVVVMEVTGEGVEDATHLLLEMFAEEADTFITNDGDHHIYLLSSVPKNKNFDDIAQEVLTGLHTLESELLLRVRAGLSKAALEVGQLQIARSQALFALEAGRTFRTYERLHRFDRLGLARLLFAVPKDVRLDFLSETIPNEVMANLSSDLRETIVCFAENGQHVGETAKSLYIHRNTLLYRIERIRELTGYDLRNSKQSWLLWIAMQLAGL